MIRATVLRAFAMTAAVAAALTPVVSLGQNAGTDGNVVAKEVLANGDKNFGYDARNDKYVDMVATGIIDPTKVVRSALQNAASVATLLLTSDAMIAEEQEKKSKKDPAPGAYDDMY